MSKFLSAMNAAKDRSGALTETLEAQAEVPSLRPHVPRITGRIGRPAGKRSSAKTVQVTAYIDADLHVDAKIALLKASQRGTKKDFSDLIQDLLTEWMKSQR